jgi:hypothetical protein
MRTDYNFAFAFFCYYMWTMRDDKPTSLLVDNFSFTLLQLIIINFITIFTDLIWLVSVGKTWLSQSNDPLWLDLSGLHHFVIFVSVVIILLKVIF